MTEFYCNSLKDEIEVHKAKVCAWKTATNNNKRGYVQGLNAKADNKCGHRLSRFATQQDVDEAQAVCSGNVNWLGHKVEFEPVKFNAPMAINRRAMRSGEIFKQDERVPRLMPNSRAGRGNRLISRLNFTASDIRPRDALDFEKLAATNLAQFGQKVQLSEATLDKLIGVDVPDLKDIKWLAERERRKALGESEDDLKANPPLGRPQRTTKKRINMGQAMTSVSEHLSIIQKLITTGQTESKAERVRLGVEVVSVLAKVDDLRKLSDHNRDLLLKAMAFINPSDNYQEAGLGHKLWTNKQFTENKGLLAVFLASNTKFSNVKLGLTGKNRLTIDRPVTGLRGKPIDIASVRRALRNGHILDVDNRRIITNREAVRLASSGVDRGFIGTQNFLPEGEEVKTPA